MHTPNAVSHMQVAVQLTSSHIYVELHELVVFGGELYQPVKAEDSIWTVEDGMLHACLLKRNRRGNYANGCTNADTFWRAMFKSHPADEAILLQFPPSQYYSLTCEGFNDVVSRPQTLLQQA